MLAINETFSFFFVLMVHFFTAIVALSTLTLFLFLRFAD